MYNAMYFLHDVDMVDKTMSITFLQECPLGLSELILLIPNPLIVV
jgi:hypothetical protein